MRKYQVCNRCVMDTSDFEITFDQHGVCSHCNQFDLITKSYWFPNDEGRQRLQNLISKIKSYGAGQEFDCVIGLSGGVDSSYLALKVKEWGLRPLVVHVDAGWNSELAVSNIESIVRHCNYDLYTHVVDWEEMRDLQLAYLRSGISNQDVPQDHIFFATLYHFALKNGIRYVFSGGNIATEGIFPTSWHGSSMDAINLKAIHKKYGSIKLRNYQTISFCDYYLWYPFIRKLRTVRPLNFMPYVKSEAIKELEATVGWRSYGRKHGESHFTKLFQNYYLPERYSYDKRLPHLSSLIVSGQLTREDALEELRKPLYDPKELEFDIDYFCKKLRIKRADFEQMMLMPKRHYSDFSNWDMYQKILKYIYAMMQKITGWKIRVYS